MSFRIPLRPPAATRLAKASIPDFHFNVAESTFFRVPLFGSPFGGREQLTVQGREFREPGVLYFAAQFCGDLRGLSFPL